MCVPLAWCRGALCRAGPVAYSWGGSDTIPPAGGVLRRAAPRYWGSDGCPPGLGGGAVVSPGPRRRRSPLPSGAAGLGRQLSVRRAPRGSGPGIRSCTPRGPAWVMSVLAGAGGAGGVGMVGGPPRPPTPWRRVLPAHSSSHSCVCPVCHARCCGMAGSFLLQQPPGQRNGSSFYQ